VGGKLIEIAKEVKSFAEGNKTPTIVLVFTPIGKSKLLSTTWWDEPMADYVLKVEINLDWTTIVGGGCIGLELDKFLLLQFWVNLVLELILRT